MAGRVVGADDETLPAGKSSSPYEPPGAGPLATDQAGSARALSLGEIGKAQRPARGIFPAIGDRRHHCYHGTIKFSDYVYQ